MQVVYLDGVFLLNTALNYLLLLCSARMGGQVISRIGMGFGAAVGGVYAVLVFFPMLEFLLHPLWKLAVAGAMVLIAFGSSGRLLRLGLIFFAVSFALGGAVYGISMFGGQGLGLERGVFYSPIDLRTVVLAAAVCYALFCLVLRRSGQSAVRREILPAVLRIGDKSLGLRALVDTGSNLVDPLTNRPVLVIDGALLEEFLGGTGLSREALAHPVETLELLGRQGGAHRYRLLPYQAVGVSSGLLLAVRLDSVKIGVERYEDMLAALSPTPLADGGDYQALIGVV